jgi:hypothetical protein
VDRDSRKEGEIEMMCACEMVDQCVKKVRPMINDTSLYSPCDQISIAVE